MEYRNHGNHNTYEVRNLSSNFITNQGNEVISNGKVHHSLTGNLFLHKNSKFGMKRNLQNFHSWKELHFIKIFNLTRPLRTKFRISANLSLIRQKWVLLHKNDVIKGWLVLINIVFSLQSRSFEWAINHLTQNMIMI